MYQTINLMPGVTLRCVEAQHFKQACLSIQFLRPMCREEVAYNALIPAVLLRGTEKRPDLRAITLHLDDLYGAAVGEVVRRIGDHQAVGLRFAFIEDRFALTGDQVLEPMLDFARELLLEPLTENGGFCPEFVEGEKRNTVDAIESRLNDKRTYASDQLLKHMCSADSFGIPRLGTKEQMLEIDPVKLYAHYRRVLTESPMEIFYVGSAKPEQLAEKLRRSFHGLGRTPIALPEHTSFRDGGGGSFSQTMEISQGKLCMGFVTPVDGAHEDYVAMQVFCGLFGTGMTSKLFVNVRERMGLCYYIGSGYYGSKGIIEVGAGIDSDKDAQVVQEVLNQLQLCREGQITDKELEAAKNSMLTALDSVYDTPGAIESYSFNMALGRCSMTPEVYRQRIREVTVEKMAQMAATLTLHTTFFLKGVEA